MSERTPLDGPKGRDLWARADAVLPGGGVYFTRSADMAGRGVLPGFIAAAQGCTVTDADGRSYIDWLCANGPNLLGYRHPEVEAAVADELTRASTASRLSRTCCRRARAWRAGSTPSARAAILRDVRERGLVDERERDDKHVGRVVAERPEAVVLLLAGRIPKLQSHDLAVRAHVARVVVCEAGVSGVRAVHRLSAELRR